MFSKFSNHWGILKNKIKRVFKRKERFVWGDEETKNKGKKISEEQDDLHASIEVIYSIIKNLPYNERRRTLAEICPEDTNERLIDYIMDYMTELDMREIRRIEDAMREEMIQEHLGRKNLSNKEQKEEENPHFPDKMIEDMPFDE